MAFQGISPGQGAADEAKAEKLRQDATATYNKFKKTQLSVAQVEETIRP